MKKLIIASILGVGVTVAVSTSTVFGQEGYMSFGGAARTVWDNLNALNIGQTPGSGFATAFIWAPGTLASSPLSSFLPFTPTNGPALYPLSAAWADIESPPGGWQVGIDAGTGNNVIGLPPGSLGNFSYDATAAFPLSGSTGPGEVISIDVIGWDTAHGLYSTLAAAEAGGDILGWSAVFQYTLGAAPPATPPAETAVPRFGIDIMPEPTTFALAGLGGLAMIFVRCRKA